MEDVYKTIACLSEGLYKEKMSKFISFAIPVSTVEEVKEYIGLYQKKCTACMLGLYVGI